MVGAGTLRKGPRDLFHAEAIYPPGATLYAEARRRLALPPRPTFVLVTGSGNVDVGGPALQDGIIVTTRAGETALRARVGPRTEYKTLGPRDTGTGFAIPVRRTNSACDKPRSANKEPNNSWGGSGATGWQTGRPSCAFSLQSRTWTSALGAMKIAQCLPSSQSATHMARPR